MKEEKEERKREREKEGEGERERRTHGVISHLIDDVGSYLVHRARAAVVECYARVHTRYLPLSCTDVSRGTYKRASACATLRVRT